MIAMVIKGFSLEGQAKERSITINQAMDGAQLSKISCMSPMAANWQTMVPFVHSSEIFVLWQ